MTMLKRYFWFNILFISLFSSLAGAQPNSDNVNGNNQKVSDAHTFFHIKPNALTSSPRGMTPQQLRHAYGFDKITNQGAGQIIAIIDAYDHPNIQNDLNVFNQTFGLPSCTTSNGCFTKVYASGYRPQTNATWALEISLDVEWAHAMAPQAKILLVEASSNSFTNLFKAVNVAVNRGAKVVSMSWGGSEYSGELNYDSTLNKSGVIFTASSGDYGTGTLYPSTSPYVLAIGGTTLLIDSLGNYLSESAWSGSGGGQSLYEIEPAYQSSYQIPIYLPTPQGNPTPRGVPDVAYNGDPNTGVPVYDTVRYQGSSGWFQMGGTSAGAPQWASLFAIANSMRSAINKTSLSGADVRLYQNATSYSIYTTNFHDILTGTNGLCGLLCSTITGYDYVTGLGSCQGNNLITTLVNGP